MSDLPEGWTTVAIGDLGQWQGGGTPPKSNSEFWTDGTVPWVSAKDMKRDYIAKVEDYITEEAIRGSATKLIDENSVLIVTRSGILRHSLPVAVNTVPVTINQDLKALTPLAGFETNFILRQLQADAQAILTDCMKTGTTVESLNFERFKAREFRVAPFIEQRRIVAKVDGLTARTARARKELDRIPTLIARYKQRLLVLAFSGQLPALNPNAARAKFYDVGDIVDISSGFGFPKDRQGKTTGDFPFAKVSDISQAVAANGGVLATASNYVDQADLKTLKAKPVPAGSIVFAKIGEALKLNRRAITKVPLILDNNCMALAPDTSKVLPGYLLRFMETVDLGPLSVATAVPSVRRGDVANLQILLPSLDEQAEIIRRIESAFGWLDRVAADHVAAARLLPKLDAAILTKAFRGDLVPQDPTDEPASVLLERIKASKHAGAGKLTQAPKRFAPNLDAGSTKRLNELQDSMPPTRAQRIRKALTMAKLLLPEGIIGQPYLTELTRQLGGHAVANELQSASGLDLVTFYRQLSAEYDRGWIIEEANMIKVA